MEEPLPKLRIHRGVQLVVVASFAADPKRSLAAVALSLITGLSEASVGLSLKILVNGIMSPSHRLAFAGAVGIAVSLGITGAGWAIASLLRRTAVERAQLRWNEQVFGMCASLPGLDHLERPVYRDRLDAVLKESNQVVEAGWAMVDAGALILRMVATTLLLMAVSPALVLLPMLALPTLVTTHAGQRRIARAADTTAETRRLEQLVFELCTTETASKEVRVYRLQDELDRRCSTLWNQAATVDVHARLAAAVLMGSAGLLYSLAYIGAVTFVLVRAMSGTATAGDVALVLTLGRQMTGHLGSISDLASKGMAAGRILQHYQWLTDHLSAAIAPRPTRVSPPTQLHRGIQLEGVFFRYPDSDQDVLHSLDLFLPAGSNVAVVGQNGAGKTTLIKLLCGFYRPTCGRITVDGIDLALLPSDDWQRHVAAAFQDFARLELLLRESVGVGDLAGICDARAVRSALQRADAGNLPDALPRGLETQLGRHLGGIDLSGGQWQKVALGRALMSDIPILLVLDEPTTALDASAEWRLLERYTATARQAANVAGTITMIVTHRFSIARKADLIVVMSEGAASEVGDHTTLMRAGGMYAELFRLQSAGYSEPVESGQSDQRSGGGNVS